MMLSFRRHGYTGIGINCSLFVFTAAIHSQRIAPVSRDPERESLNSFPQMQRERSDRQHDTRYDPDDHKQDGNAKKQTVDPRLHFFLYSCTQ